MVQAKNCHKLALRQKEKAPENRGFFIGQSACKATRATQNAFLVFR
jgi:hypothetical protein